MAHGVPQVLQHGQSGLRGQPRCLQVQVVVRGEEGRRAVLIDAPLGAQPTAAVQDPAVTAFPCTAGNGLCCYGLRYCYDIKIKAKSLIGAPMFSVVFLQIRQVTQSP